MYKVGKEELRERLKGMPPYLMEKFKNGLANHNLTLEYIIESGFRYIGGKNNKDSFSQYEINQKKLVRVLQKLKEKYEKDKEEIHDNQEAHLFEDDTEDLKAQLDILKQQYDEEKRQMKELLSSSRFLNYFKKLYPNEPRLRCPNDCEGCGWEGIKNHRWISNGKRDDDGNLIHLVLGSKCIERFFPEHSTGSTSLCSPPYFTPLGWHL